MNDKKYFFMNVHDEVCQGPRPKVSFLYLHFNFLEA